MIDSLPTDLPTGATVVATNEAGGQWRGRLLSFTLLGKTVVECEAINIGNGWISLPSHELRRFDPERIRPAEEQP